MKKTYFYISVVLIIAMFFATVSCGTNNFKVYEISGTYDSTSWGTHKDEYDLSVHSYVEELSNKNTSVSFGQHTFIGTYKETTSSPKYQDKMRKYIGTNEIGEKVDFSIHVASGEIQRYAITVPPAFDKQDIAEMQHSQEECLSIAQNFIKENGPSKSNYTLYKTKCQDYVPEYNGALYVFYFCTMIDDIKTDEEIIVTVSAAAGRVEYYYASLINAIEPANIPKYDPKKIDEVVSDKIDKIYKDSGVYAYTYEISDLRMTRLEDGKYYLLYVVGMSITQTENSHPVGERVELLVQLGS